MKPISTCGRSPSPKIDDQERIEREHRDGVVGREQRIERRSRSGRRPCSNAANDDAGDESPSTNAIAALPSVLRIAPFIVPDASMRTRSRSDLVRRLHRDAVDHARRGRAPRAPRCAATTTSSATQDDAGHAPAALTPSAFIDSSRSVFHSRAVTAPNDGVLDDAAVALARPAGLDDVDEAAGPRRHHADAVGEHRGLVERMGDQEHGRAGRAPQAQQLVAHQEPRLLVERAERLVEQDQARLRDQRAGDAHALAHAAGQLRRVARRRSRPAPSSRARAARVRRARTPAIGVRRRPNAMLSRDVEPGQRGVLLEHDADAVRHAAGDRLALERRAIPRSASRARRSPRATSTCRSPTGRRPRRTRRARARGRPARARRPGSFGRRPRRPCARRARSRAARTRRLLHRLLVVGQEARVEILS